MVKKCILHICADYPDVFSRNKTFVIERLVERLSTESRNIVISLNRVSNPTKEQWSINGDVWSVRYFSPPGGVFLAACLERLATQIEQHLKVAGLRPKVIVGHKFTVESHICWILWEKLGIPFVACFMGNTDRKIYTLKPHYRSMYRKIANNAKALIFPTPWCADYFKGKLFDDQDITSKRIHVIPYINDFAVPVDIRQPKSSRAFITVCRLDVWRIKNLHRLIKAMELLCASGVDWKLDIVGGGTDEVIRKLEQLIRTCNVSNHVRLLGPKHRTEIDALLPQYCAMVLPSYPETFGLVYIEALAVGVPVMTAKSAGIDGFFSEAFPGVVVHHKDTKAIVNGLLALSEKSAVYRENIATIAHNLGEFTAPIIGQRYLDICNAA